MSDQTGIAWTAAAVLEDAARTLAHVAAVLPGPVWNDKRVLVWSLLDAERVRSTLARVQAWPGSGGRAAPTPEER